jgi:hypothetical protein
MSASTALRVVGSGTAVPHPGQKRAVAGRLSPHDAHAEARTRAPHCTQKWAL